MIHFFKKHGFDLSSAPLFFLVYVTAFFKFYNVDFFSLEVLITYLLFLFTGIGVGLCIVFGGSLVRIIISAFLFLQLILIEFLSNQSISLESLSNFSGYEDVDLRNFVLVYLVILTMFYFIRKHVSAFLNIVFLSLAAFVLVTGNGGPYSKKLSKSTASPASTLPPYVHIVLDENIGTEGIDATAAEGINFVTDWKSHYIENGFKVYGRAFSHHLDTSLSFSTFLNFDPEETSRKFVRAGDKKFIITKNRLFEHLAHQGYQINVIQSPYLDLCSKSESYIVTSCNTYAQKLVQPLTSDAVDRNQLTSYIGGSLRRMYVGELFQLLHISPASLPEFEPLSGVENTMAAFNYIVEDLKQIQHGNAYFVHLILPHRPYLYDGNCEMKNNKKSRYEAYLDQLRCSQKLMAQLLEIFAANPVMKNSTIIIQGDHGSRIHINKKIHSIKSKFSELDKSDMVQYFSTLMAIRSPQLKAGYDLTPLPLEIILQNLLNGQSIESVSPEKMFVYLKTEKNQWAKYPMQPFYNGQISNSW